MRQLLPSNSSTQRSLGKPPRPRLSRSPALRGLNQPSTNNAKLGGNLNQRWDTDRKSDPQAESFDLPEHEHEPVTSETASSGDQSQEETSSCEPDVDVPNMISWVQDTANMKTTVPYASSSNNAIESEKPAVLAQRVKPEDDILAQWRLRRKIEQAHLSTRTRTGGMCGTISPGWYESTMHDYTGRLLPSLYTPPSVPSNRLSTAPSYTCNPPAHCSCHFRRDMSVQVGAKSICHIETQTNDIVDRIPSRLPPIKNVACMTDCMRLKPPASHTKGTLTKPMTRSVGLVFSPSMHNACVQTVIPDSERVQVPSSVESSLGALSQNKTWTRSGTIGAPKEILNAMLGVDTEPAKTGPYPTPTNEADGDSVVYTESDSRHWQSTLTTPEPSEVIHSTRISQVTLPADSNNAEKMSTSGDVQVRATGDSNVTRQPFAESTVVADSPNSGIHGVAFHETITQYLAQTAQQISEARAWCNDDPIVKDLIERRNICLLSLKSLMQNIHQREMALLESASVDRFNERSAGMDTRVHRENQN